MKNIKQVENELKQKVNDRIKQFCLFSANQLKHNLISYAPREYKQFFNLAKTVEDTKNKIYGIEIVNKKFNSKKEEKFELIEVKSKIQFGTVNQQIKFLKQYGPWTKETIPLIPTSKAVTVEYKKTDLITYNDIKNKNNLTKNQWSSAFREILSKQKIEAKNSKKDDETFKKQDLMSKLVSNELFLITGKTKPFIKMAYLITFKYSVKNFSKQPVLKKPAIFDKKASKDYINLSNRLLSKIGVI